MNGTQYTGTPSMKWKDSLSKSEDVVHATTILMDEMFRNEHFRITPLSTLSRFTQCLVLCLRSPIIAIKSMKRNNWYSKTLGVVDPQGIFLFNLVTKRVTYLSGSF